MNKSAALFASLTLGLALIIDQLIKYFIYGKIPATGIFLFNKGLQIGIIPTFNRYIAFSLPLPQIFIYLSSIMILAILIKLFWSSLQEKTVYLPISLIFAGALANMFDRLRWSAVFDFIAISYSHFYFPIFNFADMLIVLASFYLIITNFRKKI